MVGGPGTLSLSLTELRLDWLAAAATRGHAYLHEELEPALLALPGLDQLQGDGLIGAELRGHLLELLPGGAVELTGRRDTTQPTSHPCLEPLPLFLQGLPGAWAAIPEPA